MITNKAEEKNKEIGIRKVLGARMPQIAQVLLNSTSVQIAIAVVIGIPTAHVLVQEYLQKFSERIALEWWHYVTPVATLLIILLITIASTLIKAAKTNPVESLRYE
jgi:putative ABC transport system permease protein